MYTQTLQLLRSEVEAVSTLHTALCRVGKLADTRVPTGWNGPLLDEIEDAADDDGSFSRAAIDELRRRAATALANQYRAVAATIDGMANGRQRELKSLLGSTLTTGTGTSSILDSTNPAQVLTSLVKSGELRLDLAQRAAQVAKTAAEAPEPSPVPKAVPVKAKAKPVAKKATKVASAKKEKPAKSKKASSARGGVKRLAKPKAKKQVLLKKPAAKRVRRG